MIKGLWNHAIKVEDLDDATRFYVETMGAELRYASTVLGCDYRLIRLGDARILLFDRAPYEHLLDEPLPPGLLHTVYEVDDLDCAGGAAARIGLPHSHGADGDRERLRGPPDLLLHRAGRGAHRSHADPPGQRPQLTDSGLSGLLTCPRAGRLVPRFSPAPARPEAGPFRSGLHDPRRKGPAPGPAGHGREPMGCRTFRDSGLN